jgi:hypothetical protein
MSQAVSQATPPPKIGGLDEKGEPVIDQNFRNQNCDDIIAAVRLHELTHRSFFLGYSIDHFLSILMPSRLLRLRAESEVVAYGAEKEFLNGKADALEKKCKPTASATTPNGITYTAKRCESSPWGTWKLTISGPMTGQGTLTVNEAGASGPWSATAMVSGAGVAISQTGQA